ncbi:MAG: ArnT family glycosyltransferase [Candidatus Nanoarchaeia archaeon]
MKEKLFVAILLVIFAATAMSSMSQKGMTTDELTHITAGYSYVKTHDFRLNPEHPPLMKTLSGLFLLPLNPTLPDHPSWDNALTDGEAQWVYGAQFFFFSPNDPDTLLFWARLPIVLTALLLGFYIWRWAKELYGTKPAFLALILFTFSPNLLANSRIVHTDIGITTFAFITLYYWWHTLKKPSLNNTVKTGIALGLALAAKFSAVFLLAILPILAVWHATKEQQEDVKKYAKKIVMPFVLILGLAIIVIFLLYQIVGIAAFFTGLWKVIVHSRIGHHSFLMGQRSMDGWWYYFIVTFLIKTPIALLALLIARIFYSKTKPFDKQTGFILIPAAIFFLAFMFNKINIGHRHILPIYPFLYLWISPLADVKKTAQKILLSAAVILYIISSIMIFPHYLAYFNEFVTPSNAHNYVIDSNIDWGQDLKGLGAWMKENNVDNITMAYFGLDSRYYRDITWNELKCKPTEGLIAISVNRLVGLKQNDEACTKWLHQFKPIEEIGYSIKIYNITEQNAKTLQHQFCKDHCSALCKAEGLALAKSTYNETCRCACF